MPVSSLQVVPVSVPAEPHSPTRPPHPLSAAATPIGKGASSASSSWPSPSLAYDPDTYRLLEPALNQIVGEHLAKHLGGGSGLPTPTRKSSGRLSSVPDDTGENVGSGGVGAIAQPEDERDGAGPAWGQALATVFSPDKNKAAASPPLRADSSSASDEKDLDWGSVHGSGGSRSNAKHGGLRGGNGMMAAAAAAALAGQQQPHGHRSSLPGNAIMLPQDAPQPPSLQAWRVQARHARTPERVPPARSLGGAFEDAVAAGNQSLVSSPVPGPGNTPRGAFGSSANSEALLSRGGSAGAGGSFLGAGALLGTGSGALAAASDGAWAPDNSPTGALFGIGSGEGGWAAAGPSTQDGPAAAAAAQGPFSEARPAGAAALPATGSGAAWRGALLGASSSGGGGGRALPETVTIDTNGVSAAAQLMLTRSGRSASPSGLQQQPYLRGGRAHHLAEQASDASSSFSSQQYPSQSQSQGRQQAAWARSPLSGPASEGAGHSASSAAAPTLPQAGASLLLGSPVALSPHHSKDAPAAAAAAAEQHAPAGAQEGVLGMLSRVDELRGRVDTLNR